MLRKNFHLTSSTILKLSILILLLQNVTISSKVYSNSRGKRISAKYSSIDKYLNILNSISISKKGPVHLADENFLKKMSHFVHERSIDRTTSASGNGAFGYFQCTNRNLSNISMASLFSDTKRRTKIVARFGTPASRQGSAETLRSPVTIGIRFYTDEGNWDLLASSFPVFFVREGIRLPDFAHSANFETNNRILLLDKFPDLTSHTPEDLSGVLYLFSDRAVPHGWRSIDSFSANTFKLQSHSGKVTYVRFKLETQQKLKFISEQVLTQLAGNIPDFQSRDLYAAIERRDYPKWMLKAQILELTEVESLDFNPFDATRLWDEKRFPFITLGKIVLNRNPTNWFTQIEQLALNPGNLVPGIDFGPDKLLQARIQAYRDAHNYRLGANHFQLEANVPITLADQSITFAGPCSQSSRKKYAKNFHFNSIPWSQDPWDKQFLYKSYLEGSLIKRFRTDTDDNYSQSDQIWGSFDREHQERIIQRMSNTLRSVDGLISSRFLGRIRSVNFGFYCKLASRTMNMTLNCKPTQVD